MIEIDLESLPLKVPAKCGSCGCQWKFWPQNDPMRCPLCNIGFTRAYSAQGGSLVLFEGMLEGKR